MDKIVVIPDRHNPFQIWMMGACVVTGMARLFQMPRQEDAVEGLPHFVLVTWYLFLLLGGIIGLLSMVTRDEITGYLVERAAMWLLASATGFYAISHVINVGWGESFSLIFVAAFGVACLWQAWKIGRLFKSVGKK